MVAFAMIGCLYMCYDVFKRIKTAQYREDLFDLGIALLFFGAIVVGVLTLVYIQRLPKRKDVLGPINYKKTGKLKGIQVTQICFMALSGLGLLVFCIYYFVSGCLSAGFEYNGNGNLFIAIFCAISFTYNFLNFRTVSYATTKKEACSFALGGVTLCLFAPGIVIFTSKDEDYEQNLVEGYVPQPKAEKVVVQKAVKAKPQSITVKSNSKPVANIKQTKEVQEVNKPSKLDQVLEDLDLIYNKLSKLKVMFEKELIDEEEYKMMKGKIIGK
jgi:hypothetical protein